MQFSAYDQVYLLHVPYMLRRGLLEVVQQLKMGDKRWLTKMLN